MKLYKITTTTIDDDVKYVQKNLLNALGAPYIEANYVRKWRVENCSFMSNFLQILVPCNIRNIQEIKITHV